MRRFRKRLTSSHPLPLLIPIIVDSQLYCGPYSQTGSIGYGSLRHRTVRLSPTGRTRFDRDERYSVQRKEVSKSLKCQEISSP